MTKRPSRVGHVLLSQSSVSIAIILIWDSAKILQILNSNL